MSERLYFWRKRKGLAQGRGSVAELRVRARRLNLLAANVHPRDELSLSQTWNQDGNLPGPQKGNVEELWGVQIAGTPIWTFKEEGRPQESRLHLLPGN